MKTKFILLLIFYLAFYLRIFHVTQVPAGFFADEAAIGYEAYKLLTTGKDEYDMSWPIFFQSLGDYRPPVLVYSNIPSVIVFGLSEFSVRFTAIVYGVGTVLVFYLIGKKLSNVKLGLLSSFILAISPWHIHISRWGAETVTFPFYFCLGLYFFLSSFDKPVKLILSFLALGLSLYTYYPSWVIVPLTIAGLSVYWLIKYKFRNLRHLLIGGLILLLLSIPLIIGIIKGYALSRWKSVNFQTLTVDERVAKVKEYYIDHFKKEFLFTQGDIGYPTHFISRHSIRDMGQLFWFQAPFILAGVLYAIFRKFKTWAIICYLFLLYPLGSALTFEGPTATRSFIGLLPFTMITSLGIAVLFSKIIRTRVYPLVVLALAIVSGLSLYLYLFRYYNEYPLYSSDYWGWQYGPREIISYFKKVYGKYDELVMTGHFNGSSIFIPFYTLDHYPKIIAQVMNVQYDPNKHQLFAVKPEEIKDQGFQDRFKTLKNLYYPDGSVAFHFGEVIKEASASIHK